MTTKQSESVLSVPVIDLSSNIPESKLVEQIASACSTFGFFQITSHGIDPQLIKDYREQCRLYFKLPRNVKLKWKRNQNNARGYFDDELTKQRRDWKEALDVGVPKSRDWSIDDPNPDNHCLDGWNQLPTEAELPDFRKAITTYFDACASLSDRLSVLMAKGMNRDETTEIVQDLRKNHSSYLRLNYYPPFNGVPAADDLHGPPPPPLGISPHTDAGFLTVLLQDETTHSLQVSSPGGDEDEWITIHPVPGALTINTGDMAAVWSNGKYKAPLHRVLTNETMERYSTPFFYNPSYRCRVEPLVNDDEGETPIYHPLLWGYFRAVRFAGDLTDLGVEIQIDHFLRSNPSLHLKKQEIFAKEADFKVPFSVEKYSPLLTDMSENVNASLNDLKL
jgi:isopenicillin N synthase-like dioxygenase